MLIYNITFNVDFTVAEDWVRFMLLEVMPPLTSENINTRLLEILENDHGGATYSLQLDLMGLDFTQLKKEIVPVLFQHINNRFPGQWVSFETPLKQLNQA